MRNITIIFVLTITLFFLLSLTSFAGNKPSPDEFQGSNNFLEENELIQFFLAYYDISYYFVHNISPTQSFIDEQGGDIRRAKEKLAVYSYLVELSEKYDGPYAPTVVLAFVKNKTPSEIEEELAVEEEYAGGILLQPYQKEGSKWRFGPVLFRQKVEDWNKDVDDIEGVSVSYADNRLKENRTWSTKGSLSYPIQFFSEFEGDNKESRVSYNYSQKAFVPAINWKYFDLSDDDTKDVEELTFLASFFSSVSHKIDRERNGLSSWRSDFYLSPFYSTDFDFDGDIIGVNFTYEPVIQYGEAFQTSSWHRFSKSLPSTYLFRFIPGLSYSHVFTEGPFIKREENDDSFGITTSFELGLKPFGQKTPWEFKTVYNLFYDFTGEDDGYFNRWDIKLSYWFLEKTGLTLEYTDGDDFLKKDSVDLVTLGLQIRL